MAFKPSRRVPLPPMPTDPTVCRWCHGQKRAFVDGGPLDICNAGCALNDQTPYMGDCSECHREFETGRRLLGAPLCHECEAEAIGRVTAIYRHGSLPSNRSAHVRLAMRNQAEALAAREVAEMAESLDPETREVLELKNML